MLIPWFIFCAFLASLNRRTKAQLLSSHLTFVSKGCRVVSEALKRGESGAIASKQYFFQTETLRERAPEHLAACDNWVREASQCLEWALRSGRPVQKSLAGVERGLNERTRDLNESARCLNTVYWKWLIAVSGVCGLKIVLLSVESNDAIWSSDLSSLSINSLLLGWAALAFHLICQRFIPMGLANGPADLAFLFQWTKGQLNGVDSDRLETGFASGRNKLEYLMNWLPVAELFGLGLPCTLILCWDRAATLWGS